MRRHAQLETEAEDEYVQLAEAELQAQIGQQEMQLKEEPAAEEEEPAAEEEPATEEEEPATEEEAKLHVKMEKPEKFASAPWNAKRQRAPSVNIIPRLAKMKRIS